MAARLPVIVLWTKRPAWFDDAACRGTDPALFHPMRGDHAVERHARMICASCPVRHECLDHALTYGEIHGIWGGTSARQRRTMRSTR